jgi:hypothetical protein
VDDHVAHVRGLFLDTLADWPGDRVQRRLEAVR